MKAGAAAVAMMEEEGVTPLEREVLWTRHLSLVRQKIPARV